MIKIEITLPEELLQAVEKERLASGLSRSEFFRRVLEEHLLRPENRGYVQRFIKGYQENPETPEDRALVETTLRYSFDDDFDARYWAHYWEEESRR